MAESSKSGFLRSGELARLAGVSPDTLRHYERKGLLPAPRRSTNGYREYPPQAIERVRLARRALTVGFTIDELAQVLKERDRGGAPCREVRALAEEKLAEMETRLNEITAVRDELRELLQDWDERLEKTGTSERAGLLEALAATSPKRERLSPLAPRRTKNAKRRKESQ